MSTNTMPIASTSTPSPFAYSSSPPADAPSPSAAVTFSRQVSVSASLPLLPADEPVASCSSASRSGKTKAPRKLKNRGPDYQPRPPNAWILYRSAQLKVLKEDQALASKPQSDISKLIGYMWRDESPAVRKHYEVKAAEAKVEHAAKYPGYTYAPVRKQKAAAAAPVSPAPSSATSNSTSGPSTPVEVPMPYPTPSCLSPVNPTVHNLQPLPYTLASASPSVFAFSQEQLAAAWAPLPAADVWPTPPNSAAGLPELALPFACDNNVYDNMPLSAPATASYTFDFGCAQPEFLPTPPLSAGSPVEGFPFQGAVYEQFAPQEMYTPFDFGLEGLDASSVLSIESPFGVVPDATALGEALATEFHFAQQQQQLPVVAGATPTFGYDFIHH